MSFLIQGCFLSPGCAEIGCSEDSAYFASYTWIEGIPLPCSEGFAMRKSVEVILGSGVGQICDHSMALVAGGHRRPRRHLKILQFQLQHCSPTAQSQILDCIRQAMSIVR